MPSREAKNIRHNSKKRQSLAMWLIAGSLATVPICGQVSADQSDWSLDLWGTKDPAIAEPSPVDAKVPSATSTPQVQSVLGIRGGKSSGLQLNPSLKLVPPKAEPGPPASVSETKVGEATQPGGDPEAKTRAMKPARSMGPARMVTRTDAELRGFRRTWQTGIQQFAEVNSPLTLHAAGGEDATPDVNALVGPDGPRATLNAPRANSLAGQAGSGLPSPGLGNVPLPLGLPSMPVGNRGSYPAWLSPSQQTPSYQSAPAYGQRPVDSVRQPLLDPSPAASNPVAEVPVDRFMPRVYPNAMPETSMAPLTDIAAEPAPMKPIGSGVLDEVKPLESVSIPDIVDEAPIVEELTLAPTEQLPDLGSLDDGDTAMLPLVESIDDEINEVDDSEAPFLIAPPSLKVSPEATSAIEKKLAQRGDEKLEKGANEGAEPAIADSNVDDEPTVSTMQLSPIKIDSIGEDNIAESPETDVADLKPLKEATKLPSFESLYRSPDEAPSERVAAMPLDASGRPKNHAGPEAVARLSSDVLRLRQPIAQLLQTNQRNRENADRRSNWGMLHAIMVYGAETRVIARGRDYSSIAWLAGNNVCRGARLMTTERGKISVREGTGLQGHQAQFLAIMSLVGVPGDYPLYVGRKRFSVEDLVKVEAAACRDGDELTFSLIGLVNYMDTDAAWKNSDGQSWDFERLLASELALPIVGEACGGTHRLMGLAHALRKRRLEGKPITGQWQRADAFLQDFVDYTFTLQNRDGSMSTNWYESPDNNGDLSRKTQTTGHMVEFLLTYLPDRDVVDPRLVRSVEFLTQSLRRLKVEDSAVGFRGHALRSIAMFHRRAYGESVQYPSVRSNNRRVATQRQGRR